MGSIMLTKIINSFKFASKGLKATWREEQSFRMEIFISVIVLIFIFYFEFSYVEVALSVFGIVIVLLAEIVNTAIEDVCNKIEPNHDPAIGKIKDIMAGFVLVSCIGAGIVGLLVLYHHFV
jgi:diacylglycerol kinase (ATP)